jgi:effector-binding domain-containing protein
MEIRVDTVEASLTAAVAGPLDVPSMLRRYDDVYAFLRGTETDVQQVGHNVALYGPNGMEVGVVVDRTFEPVGDVRSSALPAGRIAHATHTTGYADLHRTYAAIEEWCAAHGHRLSGVSWEVYGDPDEHDHVDVEICFLLA